jgi:phosphate:Na+ symporter
VISRLLTPRAAVTHNFSMPRRLGLLLAAALVLAATPALGAAEGEAINWWQMGMSLLGGLALFLFGIDQMASALKDVAGERMKLILARLTTNRFMGALTGAFVTGVIQSSSVTTVLLVGFISAGLMSMAQSISVIMGANIGSTVTAQLIAFKVTDAALAMVAVGFTMLFFGKRERIKQYGGMIMGIGLVFFGMAVMSEAMHPLRSYQPFMDMMARMENPLLAIAIGAAFTALIQSSAATTGIVIVMASQGFITLPAGIALAFGANIGTCVTAALASIGKPREAVRAALAHVLFNIFGVLIWYGFIDNLAQFVTWISPTYPELSGMERLAAEAPRQIANAHSIFNIANTFLFIGFVSQFARLVEWLIPDKPLEEIEVIQPKYLDTALLETPSLALDRVRMEAARLGERVQAMLDGILPAVLDGNRPALREIARLDDEVDVLYGHIITYLGQVSRRGLTESQTHDLLGLMAAVNDLENIGDIIETDMVALGEKRIEEGVAVSPSTHEVLGRIHAAVAESVRTACRALAEDDSEAAERVIDAKGHINELIDAATLHQADRLVADEPNRLAAYAVEVDVIERQKRIYYFAKRIAKSVVGEESSAVMEAAAEGAS